MPWSIPARPVVGDTDWNAEQEAIWSSLKSFVDGLETSITARIPSSLVDAKGDIIAATADNAPNRLAVGANGTVLTADSAESTGVKWATPSGGSSAIDGIGVAKIGRYITTPMHLDGLNSDANVFGTGGTRIFCTPMLFNETISIDRFGQSISVAGNGNLLMGLYEWGFGAAQARVAAVSTPANSVGDKEVTTSASNLRGLYMGVIGTTDTSGSLIVRRGSGRQFQHTPFGTSAGWEMDSYIAMQFNGVSLGSGLPATLDFSTPSAYQRTDIPLIWVRRSA